MVRKNLNREFSFYCCTDNPTGLDPDIKVIPLPEHYQLETFWWKFWITSDEFPVKGKCIYLDLDTVIQNDISRIADYDCGSDLHILKAQWRITKVLVHKAPNTLTNSSLMVWDSSIRKDKMFDKFMSNPDFYMLKYPGNDDFIDQYFMKDIKTLPIDWVYCRVWGYDDTDPRRENNAPDRYIDLWNIRLQLYRMPDRMICMFNGVHERNGIDDRVYAGFEHYWKD